MKFVCHKINVNSAKTNILLSSDTRAHIKLSRRVVGAHVHWAFEDDIRLDDAIIAKFKLFFSVMQRDTRLSREKMTKRCQTCDQLLPGRSMPK